MPAERDREILEAVLRGLALDLVPGPHSVEQDGALNIGGVVLLADLATGISIRTNVDAGSRLSTSRLQLDFTGVPADRPSCTPAGSRRWCIRRSKARASWWWKC